MFFLLDLVLTGLFVALGMNSHDSSWSEYPLTVLPFVLALIAAWLLPQVRRAPASLTAGAIVYVITTAGGLALRWAFGDGLSGAFPLVTAAVLAVFFFGWRLIHLAITPTSKNRS